MKKVLSLILTTALLLALFAVIPLTAEAKTSGDYEYSENSDGTATITKYSGSASELTVPAEIDGCFVTIIAEGAFNSCKDLVSITLPDSVKEISGYAFSWCSKLETVNIGKGATTIKLNAFAHLDKISNINVSKDNKSYSSTDGNLYNKDKTQLIQYAVGKEDESFKLPDTVKTIGESAFAYCDYIKSIEFPAALTSIGKEALFWCKSLTSLSVSANNKNFSSAGGVLYNKKKTKLVQYPIGKTDTSFTFPKTVTDIGDDSFFYCESLTSLEIPDSVKTIGEVAFGYCTGLKSVTIGNGVTKIGARAFDNCENLEKLTIGKNVKKIGYIAFISCTSLKSVTIPYSVTDMYCDMEFGYYLDFNVEGNYAKVEGFKIYGYNGTLAEKYANEKGFEFISLGDVPISDISKWNVSGIKNMTYTGKALTLSGIVVSKDGKIADVEQAYKNNKNAGTATLTITGTGYFKGKIVKTFKINKAANTVKVTAKKSVTANAKKKTTIKKAVTVKNEKGKVTYSTNNKKVTVKKGAMTIAKGLKKGKTIKVKVTVTAKGNGNYKSKKVEKTVSIKVK